jgi:hypothetical protein
MGCAMTGIPVNIEGELSDPYTCESARCTQQSIYRCTVKRFGRNHVSYCRDYCTKHTQELTEGMVRLMKSPEWQGTERLHDYLEVEHINAKVS